MTSEELKNKYGDTVILGIPRETTEMLLPRGFVSCVDAPQILLAIDSLKENLQSRLRCEAELDSDFKQVIPYGILRHSLNGDIFTTSRLGGESRLKGMLSLGLGGHMDKGESFWSCLLRELSEEVGLTDSNIDALTLCGFIHSDASEVDNVHLGVVYIVNTHRTEVTCLETDKLSGAWFSLHQLAILRRNHLLESWSELVFDALTKA